MPNSRHYTSEDIKNIFDYAFTKINFTEAGLTRDTGCTNGLNLTDNKYVKSIIQKITEKKKENFENIHNSHDWVKMLKHVFQNGQIINFENINAFKEWRIFSAYSRKTFIEKAHTEKSKEYVVELKKFMAKLIGYGAVNEAQCIHLMLHLAYKIFTEDTTKENTSEKVANLLGCVFYDGLQLEGVVKSFTMFDLDSVQAKEYINRSHQCSYFLKDIIEDPLFSHAFQKTDYAQYLVMPKLEIEENNFSEKKHLRKPRSYSLESTATLNPDFIEAFKSLSVMNISKSAPDLPLKQNTEITFSYSNGTKVASQFKETNVAVETIPQDIAERQNLKSKNRLSLSLFTK